ncbi:MAG TPA: hypothetical protein VGA09_12655 [Candidatus Binatia bacterium]
MELLERVANLETDMRDVRDRLVKIESKMDSFVGTFASKADFHEAINASKADFHAEINASKADFHEAINAQTWKLVTFVCGFNTALVTAVYYIAKHTN